MPALEGARRAPVRFGIGGPENGRRSLAPDVRVPLAAADYFGGRDPAAAALAGSGT
jgi:hypothetical protein